MKFPKKLRYTREHEWALIEGKEATIGVTDFAQHELGEVVFLELPKVGDSVTKDEAFGVIESVKASNELYAPVSGEVVEVNAELPETPETVNNDPYGDGWMIRIEMTDTAELEDLMSPDEYKQYIAEEAGGGEDDEEEGDPADDEGPADEAEEEDE
ncbi:MAG: glycine cleavage system protein [Candidatus Binatota bacterium]|jgi:glycine cleavage system H protein|nr:glycine cleavage system protein [Candidatus Binatota bacterium]